MAASNTRNGSLIYDLCSTLQMVEDARATGVLMLSGAGETTRIVFDKGQVVAASSTRHARLGQELVAAGQITQGLLDTALGMQRRKKTPTPLGEILVSLGCVTADGVREVLEQQCVLALKQCLEASGGTFDFERGEVTDRDVAVRFSVGALIARAQEEDS